MELKKIKHYAQRVYQLGLSQTVKMVRNRYKDKRFDVYWRKKAAQKTAHHSWADVVTHLGIQNNFYEWHNACNKRVSFAIHDLHIMTSKQIVLDRADEFVAHCFDLLGSGKIAFNEMPWHIDFRLQKEHKNADVFFDPELYYKDFIIKSGATEQPVKDIKIPWELSRLQHFFVLGYAYQISNDAQYAQAFEQQFLDWRAKNPFLLGAHWACPMDVGIRAVNLVWAYSFFKNSLSEYILQKYVCVLYDHLFYLEHNWEVYDFRTSNHYLSDLIGYFYVCYFFYDQEIIQEKAAWCYQELLQEFEKQIFYEGTDYEGSTYYHVLVTEIFFHFEYLAKKMGFFLPESFQEKLNRMFCFIKNCTPENGTLVQIGDNDSGKILFFGITQELINERLKKYRHATKVHYKEFGLSLLKTENWHSTLRHHVYNQRQPAGHFHVDVGSITVAYQGIPIIIDPGSYLYTPSAVWRNRFRSAESHSTWYLHNQDLIAVDERLFALTMKEQNFCDIWEKTAADGSLYTNHVLYDNLGITTHRNIEISSDATSISINDWYDKKNGASNEMWCWNFILDSHMHPIKENEYIVLYYEQKPLVKISSDLELVIEDCFISNGYGNKCASKKLRATKKIATQECIETRLEIFSTLF